jgi:hypothetical protein
VQLLRVPINGDTRIEPMIRESVSLSSLTSATINTRENLFLPERTQTNTCAMLSFTMVP